MGRPLGSRNKDKPETQTESTVLAVAKDVPVTTEPTAEPEPGAMDVKPAAVSDMLDSTEEKFQDEEVETLMTGKVEDAAAFEKPEPKEIKEFNKEHVLAVSRCQHPGCNKPTTVASIARDGGIVFSPSQTVLVCVDCYNEHYLGYPIETRVKVENLMFQEGQQRRVI